MPNSLAYLALMSWPLIAVGLFMSLRLERALIWSILAAYLLLPPVAEIDFPLLPAFDKTTIPNVAALAICMLLLGRRVAWLPRSVAGRVLTVLFVASPAATVLTNGDYIALGGGGFLPGLRIHDALSAIMLQIMTLAPFILARQFLSTDAAQREILVAFVIAGLAYSIPMLTEMRLSPQTNVWIYGFFQHDFTQTVRYGGYRPIVFLPHGLWVAFFTMMCLLSAVALWRHDRSKWRRRFGPAAIYLGGLLVLCKSAAALVYAAFLVPVVAVAGARLQLTLALALAMTAVCYPLMRGAEILPADAIVSWVEERDPQRAESLDYRFGNETVLLDKAWQKPFFGWGSWGRNHVYDPDTGRMTTVTDGRWIIVIGTLGWFGYFGEFGLLTLPLWLVWRASAGGRGRDLAPCVGPLALMVGINMVDMLPNATLTTLTWLMAGSVLGYAEAMAAGLRPGRVSVKGAQADPAAGDAAPAAVRPRTIL